MFFNKISINICQRYYTSNNVNLKFIVNIDNIQQIIQLYNNMQYLISMYKDYIYE